MKINKFVREAFLRWFPEGLSISDTNIQPVTSDQDFETISLLNGIELNHAETQSAMYIFLDSKTVLGCSQVLLGQLTSQATEEKLSSLMIGVFEYFVLNLVSHWNKVVDGFSLSLKKILTEEDDDWQSSDPQLWMKLNITFELNQQKNVAILLIPTKVLNWVKDQNKQDSIEEGLKKFGHLRTLAWAEVGQVTLSSEEIKDIRKGDVILLDETVTQFDGTQLSGSIQVSLGNGSGVLFGTLVPGNNMSVQLQQFYLKESL